MFNLLRILKITGNTALQVAPAVVSVISPALGPIAAGVANQIIAAEAQYGAGKGAEKKSAVLNALPLAVSLVEGLTGRNLVQDEEFVKAIGQLIDAIVAVMNSLNNVDAPVTTVQVPALPQSNK